MRVISKETEIRTDAGVSVGMVDATGMFWPEEGIGINMEEMWFILGVMEVDDVEVAKPKKAKRASPKKKVRRRTQEVLNLVRELNDSGFNQTQVCKASGIASCSVSLMFRGKTIQPTGYTMQRFRDGLAKLRKENIVDVL